MAKSYNKSLHGNNPYYDDFDPNKKFVRVMSRPGFPLQAREVTQLQTILQSQIERMGDHFFEDGAVINGGEITETTATAVRLSKDKVYSKDQLNSFVGKSITDDAGVQSQIVAVADVDPSLTADQYQVLFVIFTTAGTHAAGRTLTIEGTLPVEKPVVKVREDEGETALARVPTSDVASNIVCVGDGIFYADGFFVKNDAGTLAVSNPITVTTEGESITYRSFNLPSASVGYQINRNIVTSEDDGTLKDPSFGFYNFNSPGADRYKVDLELVSIPIEGSGVTFDSENYFELVRIIQGQTTKQVKYTDYAILEETLARRTFDESGHYTVTPFPVATFDYNDVFRGTARGEFHAVEVGAGKAYVGGYEYESISPQFFKIRRGLTTQIQRLVQLQTPLQNFVTVNRNSSFDSRISGDTQLRDTFTKNRKCIILNANNQQMGSCNIRSIEEMPTPEGSSSGEVRLYIFNVKMNSGFKFKDSKKIAVDDGNLTDSAQTFTISVASGETALSNVATARQIFKAPVGSGLQDTNRPDLFSNFIVRKAYQFEFPAVENSTVDISSEKQFLQGGPRNHVVFATNNSSGKGATMMRIGTDVVIQTNNTPETSTLNLSIPTASGLTGGAKGTIIASQRWSADGTGNESNIRRKEILEQTDTDLLGEGVDGSINGHIINLTKPDGFKLISVTDGTRDVTSSFDLENNSTVEAYFNSRLILKSGFTCGIDPDTNKIKVSEVKYERFTHSGDGPFTVDSYPVTSSFTREDIPDFTDPETGETYNLGDAYDFRPVAVEGSDDRFDNGSGDPQVVACSNEGDISFVSYEHNLGRIDKLVLGLDREFRIIEGVPSLEPKAPETVSTDFVLGEFTIPPLTIKSSDVKYRHIDTQRTTMIELNENEKTQQFDQFFAFLNDLEQEALNRAQNFRSSRTAFSDGIFVDTFIGHNNAITAKRDHNCSVDPEFGELRPAFESSFHSMGLTGASLGTDVVKTSDNIYIRRSDSVEYDANQDANAVINANQFAVGDFLGSMSLSPSSDPYFSTIRKPKVMVNTVGEVDNWETDINAFQRGRTRGFGSQWRDWETLWFGSPKRNDVNIEHDSSGSEYTRPKQSSFVSRILSDKLIKKIGSKIVDLSVVPYTRSRAITFTANGLKPSTTHSVFFDNIRVLSGVTTDQKGNASGSFAIAQSTYLTGKKLVRIKEQLATNVLNDTPNLRVETSSSADAMYYAEGLLETKTGDSYSVRPVITKRKAANKEDVSGDYYSANAKNNLEAISNAQVPLAQEFTVDGSQYPNGMMLKDIVLHFRRVTTTNLPIRLEIRPIYNGAPHPYKVLPFSEVTKFKDDMSRTDYDTEITSGTKFEFSTPVYLRPNKSYAVCLSTNAPDYELYMGIKNEPVLVGNPDNPETTNRAVTAPIHIGSMFLPLNNGQVYRQTNQYMKMLLNKAEFAGDLEGSIDQVKFKTSVSSNVPYQVAHIHANEQLASVLQPIHELTTPSVSAGNLTQNVGMNTTITDFTEKLLATPTSQVELISNFETDSTNSVSTVIDGDRLGILLVEYMANNPNAAAIVEELEPTARLATTRSRYVSRKVTLNEAADDLVVIVDGSFVGNSQIKVYVKTQGPDTPNSNFDDNEYEELFPEGNPGNPVNVAAKFAELKPRGPVGGVMRFTTNNLLPGIKAGEFTQYQIKIVLMGEDPGNNGNASQVPVIDSIAAVPLRRISQDEIRRYTPPGSVFSWTTDDAPFGFVFCDGTEYDIVENPEMKVLFEAIGTKFGSSGPNKFKVPNLKGRTIVGQVRSSGEAPGLDDQGEDIGQPEGTRNLGDKYGAMNHKLLRQELPPHTHALGDPSDSDGIENRNDVHIWIQKSVVQEAGKVRNNSYGFVNKPRSRLPIAGSAPHPTIMPDGMGDLKHNNEQPSFVLNYIIKI